MSFPDDFAKCFPVDLLSYAFKFIESEDDLLKLSLVDKKCRDAVAKILVPVVSVIIGKSQNKADPCYETLMCQTMRETASSINTATPHFGDSITVFKTIKQVAGENGLEYSNKIIEVEDFDYLITKIEDVVLERFWAPLSKSIVLTNMSTLTFKQQQDIKDFNADDVRLWIKTNPNLISRVIAQSFIKVKSPFLPPEIFQFTSFEHLNLVENSLTSLSQKITCFTQLKHFYIDKSNLTELPVEIGQLRNLKLLQVSNNKITAIPAEIGQLDKLEEIIFTNNRIHSLPLPLFNLTALTALNLRQNNLSEIPKQIGLLTKLKTLVLLQNSDLKKLPREILELNTLTALSATPIQLSSLAPFSSSTSED